MLGWVVSEGWRLVLTALIDLYTWHSLVEHASFQQIKAVKLQATQGLTRSVTALILHNIHLFDYDLQDKKIGWINGLPLDRDHWLLALKWLSFPMMKELGRSLMLSGIQKEGTSCTTKIERSEPAAGERRWWQKWRRSDWRYATRRAVHNDAEDWVCSWNKVHWEHEEFDKALWPYRI